MSELCWLNNPIVQEIHSAWLESRQSIPKRLWRAKPMPKKETVISQVQAKIGLFCHCKSPVGLELESAVLSLPPSELRAKLALMSLSEC